MISEIPPPNNQMSFPGVALSAATVSTGWSVTVTFGQSDCRKVREKT